MAMKTWYRVGARISVLMALGLSVAGCLSPTYGTDKTATEQLFDDIGNIASIRPQKGPEIAYKPRPGIVKPPKDASLPEPQASVTQNNPAWVETPEETRQRLVAEAEANASNPNYRSPLATQVASSSGSRIDDVNVGRGSDGSPSPTVVMNESRAQAEFRQARKIQKGAYSDRRRFLSDPPLTYRAPAETAPVGELGEPEQEKEKRRLEAAKRSKGKPSWWPF